MNDATTLDRPPVRIRLLHALGKEPDLASMTGEQLAQFAATENRKRSSRMARVITGRPDRGAVIDWRQAVQRGVSPVPSGTTARAGPPVFGSSWPSGQACQRAVVQVAEVMPWRPSGGGPEERMLVSWLILT